MADQPNVNAKASTPANLSEISHVFISRMASSSIGIPIGRLATPITCRVDILSSPKTSLSSSEAPSATLRLGEKISRHGDENAKFYDTGNFIQRPQVLN